MDSYNNKGKNIFQGATLALALSVGLIFSSMAARLWHDTMLASDYRPVITNTTTGFEDNEYLSLPVSHDMVLTQERELLKQLQGD